MNPTKNQEWTHVFRKAGADPGFQVRVGTHLKKLRRAEGGANIFGVFRVKNHDFTPKNHIFPILGGRAPPSPGSAPGRLGSSCSTSGTRRVNLVTNPVISHEWGKDREVFTTSETYQRGNQNPYIEEELTTQWPKDRWTDNTVAKRQMNRQHNGQKKKYKNKQRSTKHTHKTKDRVTRT